MATILNNYSISGGDTTSSTFTSTGDCITIEATTTSINGVSSLIKIQSSDDQTIWNDIGQIIMCVGSDLYCNDPVKVTGLYVRCLLITNDSTSGTITITASEAGGGGGTQTLNQTLVLGNTTGGEDISISNGDKIVLDNGSELRVGTYDFGGTGGISRICSVGYEDMWQSGIHHIFDNNGFIRESNNCFNINPDNTFDNTLRFKVGSRWVLDDGTTYMCTDASTGAAVWVDVSYLKLDGSNSPMTGDVDFGGNNITNLNSIDQTATLSLGDVSGAGNSTTVSINDANGSIALTGGQSTLLRKVSDANTAITSADYAVLVAGITAQRQVTLPSIAETTDGTTFIIKALGTASLAIYLQIVPDGFDGIDGVAANYDMTGMNDSITLIANASLGNWLII